MTRDGWVGLIRDWALALGVMLAVVVGWRYFTPQPVGSGDAPVLDVPMPGGERFVLADREAEVYVVNFWATWCPPCRAEIPELSAYAETHPDVLMVGVSVDDAFSTDVLGHRAAQLGVRYPVAHDATGAMAQAWGVSVFPTTFVLDHNRQIVSVQQGRIDTRRLEALVAAAR